MNQLAMIMAGEANKKEYTLSGTTREIGTTMSIATTEMTIRAQGHRIRCFAPYVLVTIKRKRAQIRCFKLASDRTISEISLRKPQDSVRWELTRNSMASKRFEGLVS